MLLEELELSISHIKGIGREGYKAFSEIGITFVRDLLNYFPVKYEDRINFCSLSTVREGIASAYVLEIIDHVYVSTSKERLLKIIVRDGTNHAELVCYGRSFLADKLSIGRKIYFFGSFNYRYGVWQSSNFDFEMYENSNNPKHFKCILPVYSITAKLTQSKIMKSVDYAFGLLSTGSISSLIPISILKKMGFSDNKEVYLQNMHRPSSYESLSHSRKALAFEELFLFHALKEYHVLLAKQEVRKPRYLKAELCNLLENSLPFALTTDQKKVLEEIKKDLVSSYTMKRLLQADVGAGKTLVALLSATFILEAGEQVALLAPTELLAKQHAQNAYRLLAPLGVEVAFLSGNIRAKGRLEILTRLASGEIQLIIGTHALFSDDVQYRQLGYVIVDEQHRFGVHQRNRMQHKAPYVDLLLMSATPIPQTLQMSYMGNIDISTMYELPDGRQPIISHLVREGNESKMYDVIIQLLSEGRQAYFVYPLIEEQDMDSRKALMQMYEYFQGTELGVYHMGIIHSRMDEESKKNTMELFLKGHIQILFATSVIEVGVDVPNASVMVVYSAERFGLAALHQLRGRIGRGCYQGRCFFVYQDTLSDIAKERLKILYEYTDGFVIAEQDLRLRGPGDFGGTKQSGFRKFNIANILDDSNLWEEAYLEVKRWLAHTIDQKDYLNDDNQKLYDYLKNQTWLI